MTAMTFHTDILSLGLMEEELSTACRAVADALEILSNLRPGFTRNVILNRFPQLLLFEYVKVGKFSTCVVA